MPELEPNGEPRVIDLNKSGLIGCILIPIVLVMLAVTVLGFLGASAGVFAVLPEALKLCLPAALSAWVNSQLAIYVPAFFGVIVLAAFVAAFVERSGKGLWFRILMIPLAVASFAVIGVVFLARNGFCAPPGAV